MYKYVDSNNSKNNDVIILGRSDFLSSMFTACGCSKNLKSSRNKCMECRSVLSWAGNISRETLEVDNSCRSNNNIISGTDTSVANNGDAVPQISFRGSLAIVLLLNEVGVRRGCCDVDEVEASSSRDLKRGMRISLRHNEENLDFLVVSRKDIIKTQEKINYCFENNFHSSGSSRKRSNTCNTSNNSNSKKKRKKTGNNPAPSRIVNALFNITDNFNQMNKILPHQQKQPDALWLYQSSQTKGKICNVNIKNDTDTDTDNAPSNLNRIWFCPRGQDMPRNRIKILIDRLLLFSGCNGCGDSDCDHSKKSTIPRQRQRFEVVNHYMDATYWVISDRVPDLASVAKATNNNATEKILEKFLDTHDVACVKPSWLDSLFSSSSLCVLPSAKDRWYGYNSKPKQQRQESSKKQNVCKDKEQPPPTPRNLKVSECFLKLSKIYEQTSCLPEDEMKARQYHLVAGRLQQIDFDIEHDSSIRQLREIPFVGASTALMIKEIVKTGGLRRLDCFQKDPTRIAMRNLMAIWGVGKAKALDLIRRKFHNIDLVREGISTGRLADLDRRQLIGVQCYEDFLDDMNRNEVEIIFEQIRTEAKKILPGCDAKIMGSYRRGKTELGDLDVLIVSEEYMNKVPIRLLSELINNLWRKGYITHHLSNISGLQTVSYGDTQEGCFGKNSLCILPSSKNPPKKSKFEGKLTSCATYMGVFISPIFPKKNRRVDIKIWPYLQVPYASLYFTGGKYFNRSMRLYAKKRFNWTLNDKGLFDKKTGERVITTVCTEEDVFEKLHLIYKAPRDRKFFDDVHPIVSSVWS